MELEHQCRFNHKQRNILKLLLQKFSIFVVGAAVKMSAAAINVVGMQKLGGKQEILDIESLSYWHISTCKY